MYVYIYVYNKEDKLESLQLNIYSLQTCFVW